MNRTMVIAGRDLRERTRLFVVAAAIAVIPFLAAAMPGARDDRALAIATFGSALAAVYAVSVALALGVSVIGRDISDGRLSFYFSKPISASALWTGKAIAATVTTLAVFAIVALPSYLAARDVWSSTGMVRDVLPITLVAAALLFVVGHAASTMVRSRSALLAVDFVFAAATIAALFLIVRPLATGGAFEPAGILLLAAVAAMLAILSIAPIGQLAWGRTDARRNHIALSTIVWSGVAIVLAIAAGFSAWLVSLSPEEMRGHALVELSTDGRHLFLAGSARDRDDYFSAFIVDSKTGAYERIAASPWAEVAFNRDRTVMAWVEYAGMLPRGDRLVVRTRRFDGGSASPAIPVSSVRRLALSDDGSRVAIVGSERVAVHDTSTGRVIAAALLQGRDVHAAFFVAEDVLRIYEFANARLTRVRELDVANRKLLTTGTIPGVAGFFRMSGDATRLLVRSSGSVVDARSGTTLAALPELSAKGSAMLADGSVVDASSNQFRLFDREGHLVWQVPLPAEQAAIVGEIGTSGVLVRSREGMHVVDVARRVVASSVAGIKPPLNNQSDPRLPQYRTGVPIAGADAQQRVVLWDARTGAVHRVF